MNFKKAISFPYLNFKFFIVILILILIGSINNSLFTIMLFLLPAIFSGFIGVKLNKLKSYNSKSINKLLNYSGTSFVSYIIFLVIEFISLIVLYIPIMLYMKTQFVIPSGAFEIFLFLFLILLFLLVLLIFELLKHIGLVRYFKKKDFSVIFEFKNNFKTIFSKDFLVSILFIIGLLVVYAVGALIILSLISIFNIVYLTNFFTYFLILFLIYLILASFYSSFYDIF